MADKPIHTPQRVAISRIGRPEDEIFPPGSNVPPEATGSPASTSERAIGRSTPSPTAPATAEEAKQRFWARYGPDLGVPSKPASVTAWIAVAERVRSLLSPAPVPAPASDPMERMALAIERLAQTMEAQAAPRGWQTLPDGTPICPKHGVPMKQRSKQGDSWWSHSVDDDKGNPLYCKGYKGKDSPGYEH